MKYFYAFLSIVLTLGTIVSIMTIFITRNNLHISDIIVLTVVLIGVCLTGTILTIIPFLKDK